MELKDINLAARISLLLCTVLILWATFIEFPKMGIQRDKRDFMIGKHIKIGGDTLQVLGYIAQNHTLELSNGTQIDIDLAYENKIEK